MPEMNSLEKRVGLHSGVFRIAVVHALDLPLASPAKLLWSAKVGLAGALGPLLMGWSFDRFHSYSTALLGLAAAMLTGAGVLASLPRYPAALAADEKFDAVAPQFPA